jgi:hypothetical protein
MRCPSFAIAALAGGTAALPSVNAAPALKQLQGLGELNVQYGIDVED